MRVWSYSSCTCTNGARETSDDKARSSMGCRDDKICSISSKDVLGEESLDRNMSIYEGVTCDGKVGGSFFVQDGNQNRNKHAWRGTAYYR